MRIKFSAEMNRIPTVCVKTLVCLFVLVQCTGCSHLAKIYSRLNHEHRHEDDSDKYNYPLDKLMNRLGHNSSKDARTPSNLIDTSMDRYSRKSAAETSTWSPASAGGNALWKRRSVSGAAQKPRVIREETKDSRRRKLEGSLERRLYEDSDEDEEDEDEPIEEEMEAREYQDLDPFSYDADHRNVRHGASYMAFYDRCRVREHGSWFRKKPQSAYHSEQGQHDAIAQLASRSILHGCESRQSTP
ncbi:unnamed protein product [Bemisia tabaci]|uniref:Uncharacterized protein n=1 Tax=Bemisia tabaci TaxID=7038 RepID=A0AAI8UTY6_BEMTA|nr:unnamed protein product [Bemisia tabaci]